MAILQDVEVRLQQKDHNDAWVTLGEFDTTHSLREASNSSRRWTANVLVKEGPFRLVVSLGKAFSWMAKEGLDWRIREAILLSFTCQEGFWFNDHQVLALHPTCELPDREKRYNNLGYMAEDPSHSGDLEYILESVYTPVDPPSGKQGYARTTFSFKNVGGRLISGNDSSSARSDKTYSMHSVRVHVDLCQLFRKTFKGCKPTTVHDIVARNNIRQALHPDIDLEPQGLLDLNSVIGKPEVPHYKADGKPLIFNFIYYTKQPLNTVQSGDIDIIDKTALRNVDLIKPQSPRRTNLQAQNHRNGLASAADQREIEQKYSNVCASRCSTTTYQEDNTGDGFDFKPQQVCTPPLNPAINVKPVSSIPALSSTSAAVSNSASGPLPTPTSTPTSMFVQPAPLVQDDYGALDRTYTSLMSFRQAAIFEREHEMNNLNAQIQSNRNIIEQDEAEIETLTYKLADLRSRVDKKNTENYSLSTTKQILRDQIDDIEKEKRKDKALYEDAKNSIEALKARADNPNNGKRRRSQTSLDGTPYNGGRRTRDRSSSAMRTDSD